MVCKRLAWLLVALLFGGCLYPVRRDVDSVVCELASHPLDVQPARPVDTLPAMQGVPAKTGTLEPTPKTGPEKPETKPEIRKEFREALQMPPGLPGGKEKVRLPPPEATEEEKREARRRLLMPLPPLVPLPSPVPGPYGHPLTLAEMQQLAMSNSPVLRKAASDVEAARWAAKQAGAYPNPMFGYESDTANTGFTAGYQGFFIDQIIKAAGKLKTAEASALMNLLNAQLALRRAQTDLMSQVRSQYFGLLVARQSMIWYAELAKFTERLYNTYVKQAVGGLIAPYEPMQLRLFTFQARDSYVWARNHYLSVWKELTATLGLAEQLPLSEVAGDAEMAVPVFGWEEALAHVLRMHTDILTARNTLQRARYDLHTAQLAPYPDVDVRVLVQQDLPLARFGLVHSIQMTVPLPIWDQNKGNIRQAQATLLGATEGEHFTIDDLTSRLADAFDRYEANSVLARDSRERVLPDLARVYGAAARRIEASDVKDVTVNSLDFITHYQLYVAALTAYVGALQAQWQAVVDIASLIQTDELFRGTEGLEPPPEPDLRHLLPCSHPCNPLEQRNGERGASAPCWASAP